METPASTYDGYLQVSDAWPLNEMAANHIAIYIVSTLAKAAHTYVFT